MLVAPALPVKGLLLFRFAFFVWHRRPRRWFLLLAKFLIAGFSAVGDLGQELADSLDIFIVP